MKKQSHQYSPRPGSKIAAAIDAVRNGPMTPRELAKVLQRDSSAINTLLLRALTHAAIIKVKDPRGRLYFATPDTVLDQQYTVVGKDETEAAENHTQVKQNIIRLQVAATGKHSTLISSNVHTIASPHSDTSHAPDANDRQDEALPAINNNSASPPVVAGLFSDGELTISIGGECLQLDTAQRQQLYTYLHKIRYLE
jgi:predicted transcriptional regulator